MNIRALWERAWPHVLIIALFAASIAIYFSPLVFKGLNLKQSDASQWAGSAQEIARHRQKFGEEPLWTDGMFSGMPAQVISVIYSGELTVYAEKIMQGGLPYPASILLVALICYYILMLALGHKPPLAALGAVAFAFFTFMFVSVEAGHNSKVRAMAMAPLVLAGIVLMYKDRRLLGTALTALGMALQIGAGHYQITYYLAIFCVFLGVGELILAIKEKRMGAFAIQTVLLIVAVALGVGANAGRLLQLQEYSSYSMRGMSELTKNLEPGKPTDGGLDRDYVFNWSNLKEESFTLLIPGFMGGSSQEPTPKKGEVAQKLRGLGADVSQVPSLPLYWGDQPFTSGPVYAGAIVIFLAILAIVLLPAVQTGWLVAIILFAIMLSWGKHFPELNYLMYDDFPAYRQFRSVTMAIVMAQWALPWLAAAGLARFVGISAHEPGAKAFTAADPASNPASESRRFKGLQIALGIVGVILIAFWLSPSLAGDFSTPNDAQLPQDFKTQLLSAIVADREGLLSGDALRSLVLIFFAGGLLAAVHRKLLKPTIAVIGIAVLVLGDLWSVNMRYLNKASFERSFYDKQFAPTAADQLMMRDPYGTYRVLNLQGPFQESRTSYFHSSIGGYSPVKLRRYQDLIMGPLGAEIEALPGYLQKGMSLDSAFARTPILNMLNAKYVKFGDEADKVIQNPRAMGPCWFTPRLLKVTSPDEEYATLKPGFDVKADAVTDRTKNAISTNSFDTTGAWASLADYRSNRLTYKTGNTHPGLLVMSENYYPIGWSATIDGRPIEIHRVNYTLRAVEVPPGNHTIICSYAPASFTLGNTIAAASSGMIYLLMGVAVWLAVRTRSDAPGLATPVTPASVG